VCVRRTVSDGGGHYSFRNILHREKGYFVVGQDHGDDPAYGSIVDPVTPRRQ
jgi:hypothetical protein